MTAAYAGISEISALPSLPHLWNLTQSWTGKPKRSTGKRTETSKRFKKTEDAIAKLEERDSEIDELMTQEEVFTNSVRCRELSEEKAKIAEELETLYMRWEELAE